LAAVLNEVRLWRHDLRLGLTESLVRSDVDRSIGALRDLKALGVELAIDDFGTGYSSLPHLKRFPIDVLKIDRSFVQDVTQDADSDAIAASIISLSRHLKLKVLAEGVETADQLAYLRAQGCDEMQGCYFSAPLEADKMERFLQIQ